MRRLILSAAALAVILGGAALAGIPAANAHPADWGMMGGYGPGWMHGYGGGCGPGWMGGYGGGYGYGMGPWMMGRGMMGWHGRGYGEEYGPGYGMGPWMMGPGWGGSR